MKRKRLEQASLDAASDMMDTDSNATFAMVFIDFYYKHNILYRCTNHDFSIFFCPYLCLTSTIEAVGPSVWWSYSNGQTASVWGSYGTTETSELLSYMAFEVSHQVFPTGLATVGFF